MCTLKNLFIYIQNNKQVLKQLKLSTQMNYILREEALPFSQHNNRNNTVSHHFYQFQEKQKRVRQFQQEQKIKNFLKLIEEEQTKIQQRHKKRQARNKNSNLDNNHNKNLKTFSNKNAHFVQIDSQHNIFNHNSLEQTLQKKPILSLQRLKQKSFYQYNLQWKQKIQCEILKQKQQKVKKQEEQDKKNLKSYLQIDQDKQNYWKQKKMLRDQYQVSSKGPITGWYERFQHYVESRLPLENQEDNNMFNPQINQKSKSIASKMVGRVQDRLIKFGEIMKIKKQEMMIQQIQKVGNLKKHANSYHNYDSTWTNASQAFYRLYKDGERINRQRSEQKCQFSFRPKLTQISEQMELKIQKKRQKLPLHVQSSKKKRDISKKVLQIYKDQSNPSLNGTKKSLFSKAPFQNFMKRNQNLLNKRQQTHKKKQIYEKQRIINQQKQCTFSPVLNQKSRQMFLKMKQQSEYEKQDQLYLQENQKQFQDVVLEEQEQNEEKQHSQKPSSSEIKHYRHHENFPYFASPSNQPKQSAIQSNSILQMSSSYKKTLLHKQSQQNNGDSLDDILKFQMRTQQKQEVTVSYTKKQQKNKCRQWQEQFDQLTQKLMNRMI